MGDSSDSDSENILFSNISKSSVAIEWDEQEDNRKELDFLTKFEICFIRKDLHELMSLFGDGATNYDSVRETAKKIMNGQYADAILSFPLLAYDDLFDICMSGGDVPDVIRRHMVSRLRQCQSPLVESCALECMLIGYAYYELYCQCNYTGPELSRHDTNRIVDDAVLDSLNASALKCLESDGNYPFKGCQFPHLLLIARSILAAIADWTRGPWQRGIVLDPSGKINPYQNPDELDITCVRATKALRLRHWLSARAAMGHLRVLQRQRYTDNPTLFKECQDLYEAAESNVSDVSSSEWMQSVCQGACASLVPKSMLMAQLHLEQGLCRHHFDYKDKVCVCAVCTRSYLSMYNPLPAPRENNYSGPRGTRCGCR